MCAENCNDCSDCFGGVEIPGINGAIGPIGPIGPVGPAGPPGKSSELNLSSYLYKYSSLDNQRPLSGTIGDLPIGSWLLNQVVSNFKDVVLTGLDKGRYLITCNFQAIFGISSEGPNYYFNFELRKNDILIPLSTRTTTVKGGTYQDFAQTESTVGEVLIESKLDKITLWYYISPYTGTIGADDKIALMQSMTIWAHRQSPIII